MLIDLPQLLTLTPDARRGHSIALQEAHVCVLQLFSPPPRCQLPPFISLGPSFSTAREGLSAVVIFNPSPSSDVLFSPDVYLRALPNGNWVFVSSSRRPSVVGPAAAFPIWVAFDDSFRRLDTLAIFIARSPRRPPCVVLSPGLIARCMITPKFSSYIPFFLER